jgi:hypothetical protein
VLHSFVEQPTDTAAVVRVGAVGCDEGDGHVVCGSDIALVLLTGASPCRRRFQRFDFNSLMNEHNKRLDKHVCVKRAAYFGVGSAKERRFASFFPTSPERERGSAWEHGAVASSCARLSPSAKAVWARRLSR